MASDLFNTMYNPDVLSIGTNIINTPSVAVVFFSSSQHRVR